jgi:hypothetical protein
MDSKSNNYGRKIVPHSRSLILYISFNPHQMEITCPVVPNKALVRMLSLIQARITIVGGYLLLSMTLGILGGRQTKTKTKYPTKFLHSKEPCQWRGGNQTEQFWSNPCVELQVADTKENFLNRLVKLLVE